MASDWTKPQELDAVTCAFPANALEFMPAMADIPEEFENERMWERFVTEWFYFGLKNLKVEPKEGIDKNIALRHIGAILGSFAPKHEHKEAAAAYLCSLWFKDASWERAKP